MTTVRKFAVAAATAAFAIPTMGWSQGVTFFNDQGTFRDAATGAGKVMKGIEDFEESTLDPSSIVGISDPLDALTDNDWFNPGDIEDNLRLQSNLNGSLSSQLNPRGFDGLALQSAGFAGATSDNVVANFFVDAFDMIFLNQQKTAVGFNTIMFSGPSSTMKIDVYNTANIFLGTTVVAGDPAGNNFLGVLAPAGQFIGRINIFDLAGGAEGADNIEMWNVVPEPASFVAIGLGLALLAAARRRK